MPLFNGYVPTYSMDRDSNMPAMSSVPYSSPMRGAPGPFGGPPQMPGMTPPQVGGAPVNVYDGGLSRALPSGSWGVGPDDPNIPGQAPRYQTSFAGGVPSSPMSAGFNPMGGYNTVSSPSALAYNSNPNVTTPWSALNGANTHELEGSNWKNASNFMTNSNNNMAQSDPYTLMQSPGINVGGTAHNSFLNGNGFYQWDNPLQGVQNQIGGVNGFGKNAAAYNNLDNQVGMSPTTANAAINGLSNDQLQQINPFAMQNAFSQAAQQGANAYANSSFGYAPSTGVNNQSDYNSWLNKDYSAYIGKMNAGHLF